MYGLPCITSIVINNHCVFEHENETESATEEINYHLRRGDASV